MNLPNKLTVARIILVIIMMIIAIINIPGEVLGIPMNMFILDVIFANSKVLKK